MGPGTTTEGCLGGWVTSLLPTRKCDTARTLNISINTVIRALKSSLPAR
ncbi:hypothetical protein CE195_03185 [Sodalis-like symbiont of Philaenus spumarius]|nr:hypothetical protein CE195_03185 [Sodalis-like symbiont of Philaenus spumarius]